MDKNKEELSNLLNNRVISPKEFTLLSFKRGGKRSVIVYCISFIKNPFVRINGWFGLVLAALIILVTGLLAWFGQFHFPGLLDHSELSPSKHLDFTVIVMEILISWLIISTMFLIMAKIFKASSLRYVDFFNYCGIARIPYVILSIMLLILRHFDNRLFLTAGNKSGFISVVDFVWMGVFYGIYFWQLYLYYGAFQNASGIINRTKLWSGFILSLMISEGVTLGFISSFIV
ncbi:MAG: hypothetical protein EKK54_02380 [Neisseriaceae bacterium]|nr:MAG: hypothetical protein EKK54_02380 [Neisseriaceae bacterium]